eukprot:gene35758-45779_t
MDSCVYSELKMSLDMERMELAFRNISTVVSQNASGDGLVHVSVTYMDGPSVSLIDVMVDSAKDTTLFTNPKVRPVLHEESTRDSPTSSPPECKDGGIEQDGYLVFEFSSSSALGSSFSRERSVLQRADSVVTDTLEGGGGNALGMRVAQDIIHRHNGALVVENKKKKQRGSRPSSAIKVYLRCKRQFNDLARSKVDHVQFTFQGTAGAPPGPDVTEG